MTGKAAGELADMIGSSTETAIRQIGELRDDGILATDGRTIVLADLDRLARIARVGELDQ